MELAAVNTPVAALVAGLVTSLHCAGMCGPLACVIGPARGRPEDATALAATYQVSRVFGYTVLGAVAGAIGALPRAALEGPWVVWLPWATVVFLVALALRVDQRLPRWAPLARWTTRLRFKLSGRSPWVVAGGVGLLTPLLPCGPLYFLVAIAALSGSAVRGAEFMLAFGLGTLPLLWLAQANVGWVGRRFSALNVARVQSGLALAAAVVMAWRLRGTLGFDGPGVGNFLCH
jgi:sulfite exporter TauE/SafE